MPNFIFSLFFVFIPSSKLIIESNIYCAVIRYNNQGLILEIVNDARKKGVHCKGIYYPPVPPIRWNQLLEKAARLHSEDMEKHKYFSHISALGINLSTRLEEVGYKWKNYGENIGMGYKTDSDAIKAWINSPPHCKNIMSRNFKDMGLASTGSYWTQDFGSIAPSGLKP
ncbi:MAG: CAP domain-containing protein [Flavisolibacter sp.]